jgi:hypothetical protein
MAGIEAGGSLSLYFQLKEGEKADLEVVAQAALNWVAALREAAKEIDPEAKIRVEIVDASEGSLSLNAVLDFVEKQLARFDDGSLRHPRLTKLAIAFAVFLPFTAIPTYDFYFGDDTVQLSAEDRERLDRLIELTQGKPALEEKKKEFFRTLEKDPSIKGVGVSEAKGRPPRYVIPASEFPERSGLWAIVADDNSSSRTSYQVIDVTLISPVLIKKPRAWRFQADGQPEFSATMQDEKFLSALEHDGVREHLRFGIRMRIHLKIIEALEDGVWTVKSRSVIEVVSPTGV